MINYALINHRKTNFIYDNDIDKDLKILINSDLNIIRLRSFRIKRISLFHLSRLLEEIDSSLFVDMSHDIRYIYYLYFENNSEPDIKDIDLRQFCYFRILDMIKDVLFRYITKGYFYSLADIIKVFDSIIYNKIRMTTIGNKIYHKDYIANLKLNIKFLYHSVDNSIEKRKELQSIVGKQYVESLLYETYLRLCSVFQNTQRINDDKFKYIIDLTLIFNYIFLILSEDNSLMEKSPRRIRAINLKYSSLLSLLISHKQINILNKANLILNQDGEQFVKYDNSIEKSYLILTQ